MYIQDIDPVSLSCRTPLGDYSHLLATSTYGTFMLVLLPTSPFVLRRCLAVSDGEHLSTRLHQSMACLPLRAYSSTHSRQSHATSCYRALTCKRDEFNALMLL